MHSSFNGMEGLVRRVQDQIRRLGNTMIKTMWTPLYWVVIGFASWIAAGFWLGLIWNLFKLGWRAAERMWT